MNVTGRTPTSPSRSASGCFLMCSVRSPPDIQFEMSWKGVMVIPSRGTMFGCFKRFHVTASLQKVCKLR